MTERDRARTARENRLLGIGALVAGGFVPIQLVTLSFGYAQYVRGVKAGPDVVRQDPAKVMSAFCHHIFFLESRAAGQEWARRHGGGAFIVTLAEAFELGRRLNDSQGL